MPNLLTSHLSKTHVYYLLHNDYSSEQRLVSISWINTENLTNVPEGIFQCIFPWNFIKFHKCTKHLGVKNFPPKSFKFQNHCTFIFKVHGQICGIIKLHSVSKFCWKFSSSWRVTLSHPENMNKKKVYTSLNSHCWIHKVNCSCISFSCHSSCQHHSLCQGFHYVVDQSWHSNSQCTGTLRNGGEVIDSSNTWISIMNIILCCNPKSVSTYSSKMWEV